MFISRIKENLVESIYTLDLVVSRSNEPTMLPEYSGFPVYIVVQISHICLGVIQETIILVRESEISLYIEDT
jgi:hypothetical protein